MTKQQWTIARRWYRGLLRGHNPGPWTPPDLKLIAPTVTRSAIYITPKALHALRHAGVILEWPQLEIKIESEID